MLVGNWECYDPWNIGKTKTNSFYSEEREDHEEVVEKLFYEEIKFEVKYID